MKMSLFLIGTLILMGLALDAAAHPREGNSSAPSAKAIPAIKGTEYFVDPVSGHDDWPGSRRGPWRTVTHAVKQLKAGDTLSLLGGVYRENVFAAVAQKRDASITIRVLPGQRVILDGGSRN